MLGTRGIVVGLILGIILVLAVIPNYVSAQTSSQVYFDQQTIFIEHSSVITVEDSSANTDPDTKQTVDVDIRRNSEATPDTITIWETDVDSGVFSSPFIKFTANAGPDILEQEAADGDSYTAEYGTVTDSIVIEADGIDRIRDRAYKGKLSFNQEDCSDHGGDKDLDGICDNWEESGIGLEITAGGESYTISCSETLPINEQEVCPSPNRADLYVEIDWMVGHEPNRNALDEVIDAFDKSPYNSNNPNSDVLSGINLHIQLGEETIQHMDEIPSPGGGRQYGTDGVKKVHFGAPSDDANDSVIAKGQVFHYVFFGHSWKDDPSSSGFAEIIGNDVLISLGSFDGMVGTQDQQAGTLMHELGHNLGLSHMGDNSIPESDMVYCAPNYISVMSYARQFSDLVNRDLNFSSMRLPPTGEFDESNPDSNIFMDYPTSETVVYGDDIGESHYAYTQQSNTIPSNQDLNYLVDSFGYEVCPPNSQVTYPGYNDWENIVMDGFGSGNWAEGRKVGSPSDSTSLFLETDEVEYALNDDVKISGKVSSIISGTPITITIQSPTNNIVNIQQLNVNSDGSFETITSTSGNLWKNEGLYKVSARYGTTISSSATFAVYEEPGICYTQQDVLNKIADPSVDRICASNELTIEDVISMRIIRIDRIENTLQQIPDSAFIEQAPVQALQKKYSQQLDNIRELIRQGDTYDALLKLSDFEKQFDGKEKWHPDTKKDGDDYIKDKDIRQAIFAEIQSTKNSQSKSVPEFSTIATLVLIFGISSIIIFSKRENFQLISKY